MTTKSALTITVKNDDEGMFGSESTENINVEKSISGYEKLLRRAIKKAFPGAEINLVYGGYGGKSIIIDGTPDEENISDEVSEIVANVYNNGAFWIDN
jgi:hypothetical protein